MAGLADEPAPDASRSDGAVGGTAVSADSLAAGRTAHPHRRLTSRTAVVLVSAAALAAVVLLARGTSAVPEPTYADLVPAAERSYYSEPACSGEPTCPDGSVTAAEPGYAACEDPAGDSVGDPDLVAVAMDRPAYPFWHYHWDGSRLPAEGAVEVLLSATSADGQRSRELMVVLRDGAPDSQYVRDPGTGEIAWLHPDDPTGIPLPGSCPLLVADVTVQADDVRTVAMLTCSSSCPGTGRSSLAGDHAADHRDHASSARDPNVARSVTDALRRDRAADQRDRAARARDDTADARGMLTDADRAAAADRGQSAVDREHSGRDRDRSASDRLTLRPHRAAAARLRHAAEAERAESALDRMAAEGDRVASQKDREAATADRKNEDLGPAA